jgi:cysteine desulfurase
MKNKIIYLDHAATTYLDSRVKKEMDKCYSDVYGNPGSLHSIGREANELVETSREIIAKILNCKPNEIIFTSGGTESINLAIKGVAFKKEKGHIITSKVEHPAVIDTCKFLEKKGFSITYLNVDKFGLVNPKDVEKAIRRDTILISIMYANNEIGTVEPIKEIGRIARRNKIIFHTDACQAAGALDLDVNQLNVDLMTLNGSKIYGPKGIGILYKSTGIKLEPLMHGGGQEFGLRSGTENVPGIIGITKALELSQEDKEKENARLIQLRDYLITSVLSKIEKSFLNGHPTKRLPNNVNISFLDVEGESVVLYLDHQGIEVSTGSACSSQKLEISHVLDAIGLIHDAAHGSIRFTLGHKTTKTELDYTVKVLEEIIENLRRISPINVEMKDIRNKSVESKLEEH